MTMTLTMTTIAFMLLFLNVCRLGRMGSSAQQTKTREHTEVLREVKAPDEHSQKILDEMEKHPENVNTINGKPVSPEEFHAHAALQLGEDYHPSLAHIHTTVLEGNELKDHIQSDEVKRHMQKDKDGDILNPATIRRQLLAQGVSEKNLDRLTEEILQAHRSQRVTVHHTHEENGKNLPKVEFKKLISHQQVETEFRKIDKDRDGRVYIKEVKEHFERLLDKLNHDSVKADLKNSHFSHDVSPEGIRKVHAQLKDHYEEQLGGLDTIWGAVDKNKDGYIGFPEYEQYVQEAHWLAHQEKQARDTLGEDMHLFDPDWREEL